MKKYTLEDIPFLNKTFLFFSERKLRYDIVSSFLLLFLFENIITLSFTYKSNSTVALEFARHAMTQNASSVVSKAQRYLDDVQKIVMLCHSLVDLKNKDCLVNPSLQACLLQSMKQYSHFANICIGLTNGNYLGVERRNEDAKFVTQSDKILPNNIRFLLEHQDRSVGGQGIEMWYYYNVDGVLVGEEKNEILNFDPRTRPWFTMAEQKGDLVWTEIYVSSGSTSLCVSAAVPIYVSEDSRLTKMAGVISVDLLLDELSLFMKTQKISDRGVAFIVSKAGQIVAYPTNFASSSALGGQRTLTSITESPDKQVQIAFQRYKDSTAKEEGKDGREKINNKKDVSDGNIEFHYNGETYLASFTPITNNSDIDWMVGVVVPKNDFAKSISGMQRNEIFLILFVALIATLVTFYLSKRISSPIMAIAEETQRLKDFYETEPLDIKSNIAEIKKMIDSIAAMRSSLQSFGKFVPKVLVRRLMQKGTEVKLGGKSCDVTMFFSDIQGFTSISEKMSADKLVLHLSDYFNELSKIIVDTNGTIDKYIGDSIMAFWNAPSSDKNHVFNACRAALMCQKRLTELNRQWELEKKPTFLTRIGLHTTEVIVGNIGSDEKINYTLMGDGVNLGSRLEGTNKVYKTWILASETVHKIVEEKFLFRPVDVVSVKGKEEGTAIFELVGQMAGDSHLLPSKEEVDLCERFTQGFKLYREQRWGEAIRFFETLRADFPQDYLTGLFLERCLAFKDNPPKRNWNGIFVLTQK
ncbi:adenylate/guanylate cyclase domain-containing protein [Alphaproteobacteria bacterium]|nr:adenylate/guanylate cyclase domain-containing protein [Alphaproteobacteria bacterium]GHS96848.1 adenylate/guanylate cyclase domain-containing protein [Alphaproteobacteria bacterium]